MRNLLKCLGVSLSMLPCLLTIQPLAAQEQTAQVSRQDQASWQETVDRAVEFLRIRGQAEDGSFSAQAGIGPTGLVAASLLAAGLPASDPMVAKALSFLEAHVQPDGGIYKLGSSHRNYDTCIAMVAFSKADQADRFEQILSNAERFVKGIQWDESEGREASDMDYGGAGYGSHERPDLSNTSFFIEALHELGNGSEDEAIQKALQFVSRCQNLESEHNNSPFAAKINDGGFYYTVAAGGESKAGEAPNGGLRSYASMTYAGLKSMIYAGVTKDDPRVRAAIDYLRNNYTLESNPGVGQQGLFYYYHTMAKALDAFGESDFADAQGTAHPWKGELLNKLAELQQDDGSWVNPTTRWMEGDPNLVTAYALLALAYCQPR
ncbi:MAG: terpene cyclase/mutase family protein [bacterium]|nr:terpene cyclase/mutase family protein [bacterium]